MWQRFLFYPYLVCLRATFWTGAKAEAETRLNKRAKAVRSGAMVKGIVVIPYRNNCVCKQEVSGAGGGVGGSSRDTSLVVAIG
jgi:hypothetical protein